ncbi:unnamed protein product [Angiostrongylus costaricensis]|uniref:Carn_acyltransf domain-containing protein n=1 Tax=Angiostrongylus costaricensis TaxID=334426 RepID=A0A0R3PVS9_ANGCS|nr:unnamed protein product [Angiostrongylus costaricensis]
MKWVQASMDNRLWPVRPLYFTIGVTSMGLCVISIVTAYIPVFLLRQFLSCFYFSYKRYLFEDPKKPSLATKVWHICHKLLLLISPPILKSNENLLPSPTVPNLEETVFRYLDSVKNILRKVECMKRNKQAQSFLENEGRRLQKCAWIMSMTSDNYITPLWEKYAYLYRRCPLLVHSSVAHADLLNVPANRRMTEAFMAAHISYYECMSQLAIDRQAVKPLGNGLVCSNHYDKLYSTCRIPGERIDKLMNYGISKHIVAIVDGRFYKVMLCDEENRIYSINQLAKIYTEMLSRGEKAQGSARKVAALTADSRDRWAHNRLKFFVQHPVNAVTLRQIESYGYDDVRPDFEENPDKISHFLRNMLTGNGIDRWADKSLNYVVSKNGRVLQLLQSSCCREFGKGLIKAFGVSPDAFVQMAIQLANYWDQERFVLTYESASARFYKNSRTETLRTVTNESCEFVLSMLNERRLRAACAVHTKRNKETGQGIDKHLFVLYLLSQGSFISSPFLDHYIVQPWLLSTSHIPNVTNQINEDDEVWKSWIGACFGAVTPRGYGVCYRFGGNHSIFAHVTSYKSAENTDSTRFRCHLSNAFREMANLFSTGTAF